MIERALGGEWRTVKVSDPLARRVDARFLLFGPPPGRAVVEVAEAVGLSRLRREERDPMRATSRGVGELVLAAAEAGAESVFVALGGSATVDGGAGMREVLTELPVPVVALCDVRNPLLGPRGAARAFGPQKGASPGQVEELERRLAAMEELAPVAELPGAGSAGGLGAAFAALGAELVPGIEFVLDCLDFPAVFEQASLAITGEGGVDRSSLEGKAVGGVVARCRRARLPCIVFGGQVELNVAHDLYRAGATSVFSLSGRIERASDDLEELGAALGRLLAALRRER